MNKKTVLITGGAKGIGLAISLLFARNDYNVIVNYFNSQEEADKLKKQAELEGLSCRFFRANIANRHEVDNMINYGISEFGAIDVLINNAGIAESKVFMDISMIDWNNMIDVNLTGVFNCTQSVLKEMISQKSGKVINISSIWGMVGASCEVHYSTVKAGIIGFTKALAKELAPSNIQVNCVAPGIIMTDMLNDFSNDELNSMQDEIPMGRIGLPDDISHCVLFLASKNADYITGQVLSPNGGLVM